MTGTRIAALFIACCSVLPLTAQLHPNHARGFDAHKMYQMGEVDSVNLFSGNLVVTLPIGQVFRVSDQLQYQLRLVNNGNPWEYRTDGAAPEAYPSRFVNAGIGWQLTMGDLIAPDDTLAKSLNKGGNWVYAAPDGSEHVFHRTLHDEEAGTGYEAKVTPAPGEVVGYTRDSSYLRLIRLGMEKISSEAIENEPGNPDSGTTTIDIYVARYAVEFPDGTVHTFQSERYASTTGAAPNSSYEKSAKYGLTLMRDRSQNSVSVADTASRRTITDSTGRTHVITYDTTSDLYQFRGTNVRPGLVTSVKLAAFGGQNVEYAFTYGDYETISTPCAGTQPPASTTTKARFLKSVVARNHAAPAVQLLSYAMENFLLDPDAGCSFNAGHLTKLITDPLGRSAAHYFNVYIGYGDAACFPSADKREYGLPFTRTTGTGAADLHLSSEVFPSECVSFVPELDKQGCPTLTSCKDASNKTVQPVRRTYLRYDYDDGNDMKPAHHNQRVVASRTLFLDDAECGVGTTCHTDSHSSEFDGLGHYRSTTTSSNSLRPARALSGRTTTQIPRRRLIRPAPMRRRTW